MIRYLERGIQEDLLEDDSELRNLVGDLPHLRLEILSRGKLIVNKHKFVQKVGKKILLKYCVNIAQIL